ncbi:MAG: hypothetical protein ABW275_02225 [Hansschlegelia sp.]
MVHVFNSSSYDMGPNGLNIALGLFGAYESPAEDHVYVYGELHNKQLPVTELYGYELKFGSHNIPTSGFIQHVQISYFQTDDGDAYVPVSAIQDLGGDKGVDVSKIAAAVKDAAATGSYSDLSKLFQSYFKGADEFNGSDGKDGFWGGKGNDVFHGSAGGDAYDGSAGFDTLDFTYSQTKVGINLAKASSSWTGDAKNSTLTSIEDVTGSVFNDKLTGGSQDMWLDGHFGKDKLTGGSGHETFAFSTNDDFSDTIVKFGQGDQIGFEKDVYHGLKAKHGDLKASDFLFVDEDHAVGSKNAHIIYDHGKLYYDVNGTGAEADLIAKLSGHPDLSASDIVVF